MLKWPAMLKEIPTRQVPGEPARRWFMSTQSDLIVWFGEDRSPSGFQFCYDKLGREHALTWTRRDGFSHLAVDTGPEGRETPFLVANGAFDPARIRRLFRDESAMVPREYAAFVEEKMSLLAGSNRVVSIEAFHPSHAAELVRMWRESFEAGVGIVDPHPIAEQEEYLRNIVVPNNVLRVAVIDGQLVGFVAATPESVSQLYVRVGFQRRGIGTRLLGWAKAQSRGSLWLATFQRNAGARAFYEREGFVIVAQGHEPFWDLPDLRYEWKAA